MNTRNVWSCQADTLESKTLKWNGARPFVGICSCRRMSSYLIKLCSMNVNNNLQPQICLCPCSVSAATLTPSGRLWDFWTGLIRHGGVAVSRGQLFKGFDTQWWRNVQSVVWQYVSDVVAKGQCVTCDQVFVNILTLVLFLRYWNCKIGKF